MIDALCLLAAFYLAHFERLGLERTSSMFSGYAESDLQRLFLSGVPFIFFLFFNFALGLYSKRNDFWEELRRGYVAAFLLLVSIVMILFISKSTEAYSRTFYMLMFLNLLWVAPLGRVACKKMFYRMGLWQTNAFLVGNEAQMRKLSNDLAHNWYLGYRSVEAIEDARVVFIATRDMKIDELEALIHRYKSKVKDVMLIPYLHNISFANAEIIDLRIGRMSFINIQNQLFIRKNLLVKKVSELLLLLLFLSVMVLVMALIAVMIKLDSRGPVFFRQRRLGRDLEPFECFKFRTMYVDNAELLARYLASHPEEKAYYERYHKYRNDPRITRVGYWLRRLSLDELPQIINVFRLEMNLIGPRPYMLDEQEQIGADLQTIVHVRPGLTGLWQISGRNELAFADRVELDVWYIQNWSLWLDFIIFVKTFEVLLTRRGAQ